MLTLSEVVQCDVDERQIHEGQEHDVELVVARRHPPLLLDQTEQAFNLVAFPLGFLVIFPRPLAVRLRRHDPDVAAIRNDLTRPVVRTGLVHHQESDLWPVPLEQFPAHRRIVAVAGRQPQTQHVARTRRQAAVR